MPLIKRAFDGTHTPAQLQDDKGKMESTKASEEPKKIGGVRKPGDKATAPMTKDEYWRQREERDIEKDKHIRLSGILQALLGSVNFGQYVTTATKEAYLMEVEQAALRLAKFVTEMA